MHNTQEQLTKVREKMHYPQAPILGYLFCSIEHFRMLRFKHKAFLLQRNCF